MWRGIFDRWFWLAVVLHIASTVVIVGAAYVAFGYVREHGLKSIIEPIWEGQPSPSTDRGEPR